MTSRRLIAKNKLFYCWFYYRKTNWYILPGISVEWENIPFTIYLQFLNFSLQITKKLKNYEHKT